MKTDTSIAAPQRASAQITPKPTKAQIINAIIQETIAARMVENAKREQKRLVIQAKMDKEIQKLKKRSIKIGDLVINNSSGPDIAVPYQKINGTPEMARLASEIKKLAPLTTCPFNVKEEVVQRMENEMIAFILSQPGMKNAIQSTIQKLGL
jgi:hypothetical protein